MPCASKFASRPQQCPAFEFFMMHGLTAWVRGDEIGTAIQQDMHPFCSDELSLLGVVWHASFQGLRLWQSGHKVRQQS